MSGPWGRSVGGWLRVLALVALAAVFVLPTQGADAQKAPPCNLVPQLRDVTVNQGVGAYTPLVNGKETLVRFYLSMPSCAGSGASIQIRAASLTLSGGATGTISSPTPELSSTAYPIIASFTAAPMADSTGDPKFVVPAGMVSKTAAFTANFSTTITYASKATRTGSYGTPQQIPFATRPGGGAISAAFDRPSNALGVLFVPMGDATKTYSTQWTATAQQALQDGMTAAVARQYPLPSGIGNLGGTGGLRYMVAPTLINLRSVGGVNLLDINGKFCGTGANYDKIKAELAQFRLSHNTANPNAQANRVVGVLDPALALGPPSPCFEGMAVVNSQEAWAIAHTGRAGNLIGLELAHTLGLTPPNRESPFDGAHSQNTAAENPPLNRRFNVVQRSFITTDRSLMKPSATSPSPDNVNTLLETPDYAFLLCVLGGTPIAECTTYGPGTVRHLADGNGGCDGHERRRVVLRLDGSPDCAARDEHVSPRPARFGRWHRRVGSRRAGDVPALRARQRGIDERSDGSRRRPLLVRAAVRVDGEPDRALEGRSGRLRLASPLRPEPNRAPAGNGPERRLRADRPHRGLAALAEELDCRHPRDVHGHEHQRLRRGIAAAGHSRRKRLRRG
jgi:hypothetical protein